MSIFLFCFVGPLDIGDFTSSHRKLRLVFIVMGSLGIFACFLFSLNDMKQTEFKSSQGFITETSQNKTMFKFSRDIANKRNVSYFAKKLSSSTDFPYETNKPFLHISQNDDLLFEKQQFLRNILDELLRDYPNVLLYDMPSHNNKGDSAIALGEIALLKDLGKNLLRIRFSEESLSNDLEEAMKIGMDKVAVLLHGGGNLMAYEKHDRVRQRILQSFKGFKTILFPQSVWLGESLAHVRKFTHFYRLYPELVMLIRDVPSLKLARQLWPNNTFILCPDAAFSIGEQTCLHPPTHDIAWMKRSDKESGRPQTQNLDFKGLKVHLGDWYEYKNPHTKNVVEHVTGSTEAGFDFLCQGRVTVTDRLHGHILSTMLRKPHVLIDSVNGKVLNYHKTWTHGLEGSSVITATSAQDALEKATALLKSLE